jgi:hypothetical protein
MVRTAPFISEIALVVVLGCGGGGANPGTASGRSTGATSGADARADAISDAGFGDDQSDAPAFQLPIECTPAPMCGQPTFGSCSCAVGRGCWYGAGSVYECTGDCYNIVDTCSLDGGCIETDAGARCASTGADCDAIAAAYTSVTNVAGLIPALSGTTGLAPGGYPIVCGGAIAHSPACSIIPGHCAIGLGACWYLGDPGVIGQMYTSLDNLARTYQALGCATATACNCPQQPASVSCETNPDGGFWTLAPGFMSTYECVVH